MKDIKVAKKVIKKVSINTDKIVAQKIENKTLFTEKQLSYFPAILFGFMTTSILCYVFLISSSIFSKTISFLLLSTILVTERVV